MRHNRSYIGIEISQEYTELLRQRIIKDAALFNEQKEVVG